MLDCEMREPLFRSLEATPRKIRIVEEMRIHKCIADAVAVTEVSLTGYEIKSDSDSYSRLKKQVKYYNRYFDYNYLVIGRRHLKSAAGHIPPDWGIISVIRSQRKTTVEIVRDAAEPKTARLEKQMSLLWKRELLHILQQNDMPGYKSKSKKFICEKLLERVEHSKLKQQLCDELFERDYD